MKLKSVIAAAEHSAAKSVAKENTMMIRFIEGS
jgi:hypothetical protein